MSSEAREQQVMEQYQHMPRLAKFSKGKASIVKKATELAAKCDVDVGVLLFSPRGRLTSFASNGRIEDIFLRYFNQLDVLQGESGEEAEALCRSLERLKHEATMIEKLAKIEALQAKLFGLKKREADIQNKMRQYEPDLDSITSVGEAEMYRRFLTEAIQNLEQEKLKLNVQQSSAATTAAPATALEDLSAMLPGSIAERIAQRNAGGTENPLVSSCTGFLKSKTTSREVSV